MASTYSTSLRLELMATGDQSGTWGDTTNTNLGTLLEQAITGVLSVAQGDATLTLTALDGATDQARNAVVNLTGAMTGAQNVVVPNANKLYLIKNSTSGGFAVTVKTSAGTGVVIAAGTSQWVYADGTNVVRGLIGNGAPDADGNISANSFLLGYATTATAAGTTVLTVASAQVQYFTGTSTQTVTLPVVSTLVLGQSFEVVNLSTGAVTVNSSGGNLVTTVSAGSSARVQAILVTGTTAASWNVVNAVVAATTSVAGIAELATAAEFRTGTDTARTLVVSETWSSATEVTLTDAATIAVDGATFLNAVVTLGGNRTLGTWSNPKAGQSGYIRVVQDATGSRTLAYHADYEFAGGAAPVLSTAANSQDMLFYQVIASGRVLLSIVKAIS